MVLIREATIEDVALIRKLAEAIWWPTYTPILSKEQISYMLRMMYSEEKLYNQIDTGEQAYILLFKDDEAQGFASYAPRPENPEVYKLHKLYCLVNGKGYGKAMLDVVETDVKNAGKKILELNVNRYNPAQTFYKKHGFSVIRVEDIQIGNGYEMNDFVMQKIVG